VICLTASQAALPQSAFWLPIKKGARGVGHAGRARGRAGAVREHANDWVLHDAGIRRGAGRLLEHAASNGLLPEGGAGTTQPAEALIHDVVYAQEAARTGRLTPQIVIAFWVAYGRLAHLVAPVTATSLAACKQISLTGMKIRSAFLVVAIISFSIFLFMSNATLNETSELIEQQNAAALKLWSKVLSAFVPSH
jgi:hypothetical protein